MTDWLAVGEMKNDPALAVRAWFVLESTFPKGVRWEVVGVRAFGRLRFGGGKHSDEFARARTFARLDELVSTFVFFTVVTCRLEHDPFRYYSFAGLHLRRGDVCFG